MTCSKSLSSTTNSTKPNRPSRPQLIRPPNTPPPRTTNQLTRIDRALLPRVEVAPVVTKHLTIVNQDLVNPLEAILLVSLTTCRTTSASSNLKNSSKLRDTVLTNASCWWTIRAKAKVKALSSLEASKTHKRLWTYSMGLTSMGERSLWARPSSQNEENEPRMLDG